MRSVCEEVVAVAFTVRSVIESAEASSFCDRGVPDMKVFVAAGLKWRSGGVRVYGAVSTLR